MFDNVFNSKKVLVTGHTGFKGSWLSLWLLKLGAEVVGYSKDIPTEPALFDVLGLKKKIKHIVGDVCDLESLSKTISTEKPDFIFHLAAQAIVSKSYLEPVGTMQTNVVGTMNVLESIKDIEYPCICILITSDKCYDNVEWIWGYRESDGLGGKDIYSGSKGAAELIIKSYFHSFFQSRSPLARIATGRAGNVIGGGDWAKDRIVADIYRAWNKSKTVEIRSPYATRPWQHVLEPLSGYLTLATELFKKPELSGESYNFGPKAEQNRTVLGLLQDLSESWKFETSDNGYSITGDIPFHEAGLLKLNCDKALAYLKWEPVLDYHETVRFVGSWYEKYYRTNEPMLSFTEMQIDEYVDFAYKRGRMWANP